MFTRQPFVQQNNVKRKKYLLYITGLNDHNWWKKYKYTDSGGLTKVLLEEYKNLQIIFLSRLCLWLE